jgi:hypothetical protein
VLDDLECKLRRELHVVVACNSITMVGNRSVESRHISIYSVILAGKRDCLSRLHHALRSSM